VRSLVLGSEVFTDLSPCEQRHERLKEQKIRRYGAINIDVTTPPLSCSGSEIDRG
jgi:hypothetical protein